ncbi:hypothetical protein V2J09_001404 [Rumex salicifolius]
MTTIAMDPDVVKWGLHNLYVHHVIKDGPHSIITQYDADLSSRAYVNEGYCEKVDMENDEVIARALQEELSKVAKAEASGLSGTQEQKLQESILSQDWRGSSLPRACSTDSQLDADRIGTSVPCETIEINIDDCGEPPELTEECILDGEVGKRLNQMLPVPHVPKINSQIPTEDDAESDHQRLLDRLKVYELVELKMKGDGNCQFRALSDQLYRSTDHHSYVRQEVVVQLKSYPDLYSGYVPMPYAEYLKRMSKNGEWGDHVTLQAAADTYGVKIFVLTSFKDTCYIEILPRVEKSSRGTNYSEFSLGSYSSI